MREMLPPHRAAETIEMTVKLGNNDIHFAATFGFNERGEVKELFCLAFKTGTDLQTLLHQSCMVISLALQHGASTAELARILGEDDQSPPRSIIGAMIRTGVMLDQEALARVVTSKDSEADGA